MTVESFLNMEIENIYCIGRYLVEIMILYILLRYRPKTVNTELIFDEKTKKNLIDDFKPEDLVTKKYSEKIIVTAPFKDSGMYELADFDVFDLRFSNRENILDTLRGYGVGTCGPPGFYGTLDLHLELEKKISNILGTENAIIYSNSFTCINSVLTCFCKQFDMVFYHVHCNEAIIRALGITKGSSVAFNSLTELEDKIPMFYEKKKRNFIVTEGLFRNTGEIIELPRLLEIKKKYKLRLIVDESLSIPLLGIKGISSYFNTDINDIDVVIGSLAHVYCGNGGFSAANKYAIDYQRLSAQSYCFSASLPGFVTKNAIDNLDKDLVINMAYSALIESFHLNFRSKRYIIISNIDSPMVIITNKENLEESVSEYPSAELLKIRRLKRWIEGESIRVGIVENPYPSIRVNIKAKLTKEDVLFLAKKISEHCDK